MRDTSYSSAESKPRKATDLTTAATNGVEPQFSKFSDIKAGSDKSAGEPKQSAVGYHKAD